MDTKKCKECVQGNRALCHDCAPSPTDFSEWQALLLQMLDDDEDLLVSWASQIREYFEQGYSTPEAAVMVENLEAGDWDHFGSVGADYNYSASLNMGR